MEEWRDNEWKSEGGLREMEEGKRLKESFDKTVPKAGIILYLSYCQQIPRKDQNQQCVSLSPVLFF